MWYFSYFYYLVFLKFDSKISWFEHSSKFLLWELFFLSSESSSFSSAGSILSETSISCFLKAAGILSESKFFLFRLFSPAPTLQLSFALSSSLLPFLSLSFIESLLRIGSYPLFWSSSSSSSSFSSSLASTSFDDSSKFVRNLGSLLYNTRNL